MLTHVRVLVRLAALGVVLLSACGGEPSSPAAPAVPTAGPGTVAASIVTTTTAAPANQPVRQWSFDALFTDGVMLDVAVDQFEAGRAGEVEDLFGQPVPTRYGGSFRGSCPNLNPERDLVVPIRLRVRNTTPEFATNLYVALGFGDTSGQRTKVFSGTEDGLCTVQVDAVNLGSGSELSVFGYAIVQGYRTPAAPEGDTAIAPYIRMGMTIQTPFAGLDHVTRQAGPQADDCTPSYSSPAPYECLPLAL